MREVRDKSVRQVASLAALIEQAAPGAFRRVTPTDPARHGSQLCLSHPDAYPIVQALIARGVIGDFRAPDILRFGVTPLTLGYAELWDAAAAVGAVMAENAWRDPAFALRGAVT